MTDYGAIYARKPFPATLDWATKLRSGANVELDAPTRFIGARLTFEWEDESLALTHQRTDEHRDSMIEQLREDCRVAEGNPELFLACLDACSSVVFVMSDSGLGDDSRALAVVRSVQRELGGMLIRDRNVEDENGKQVALLPPDPDDEEIPPPTAERVAARALVLAAVVARGHLEHMPPGQGDLQRLIDWMDAHELWDEAEAPEQRLLRTPRGKLDQQTTINSTWRSEGLVVLAWALGLIELPAHDEPVDPQLVTEAVGLFERELPAGIRAPKLRSPDELSWQHGRCLGLHWRLRDFSLRPVAMDFEAFAAECWFGSFDIAGIGLIDKDLSVRGSAISNADPQAVGMTNSVAMERHQACNWLAGYDRVYSRVDTST